MAGGAFTVSVSSVTALVNIRDLYSKRCVSFLHY